jgi:ABC-type sugar transport system ATPase subunit
VISTTAEDPELSPTTAPAGPRAALRVTGLSKTFGTTQVLRDVDLEIRAGEIHAFVGANGSGKSTTIKVLAGYHGADPGAEAELDGTPLDLGSRAVKRHDDLRFVHQDLGLVPDMNAVDNMALTHGFRHGRFGRIDWAAQREFTRQALQRFGTSIDIDTPLESLSAVVCTEIAIAAAMHGWEAGQGVLVLDEPTAMLPPAQVGRLFEIVRQVRSSGASVLYVSHRLDEIFELADRVSVIRGGHIVATRDVSTLTTDELADLMVGQEGSSARTVGKSAPSPEVVLRADELTGKTMRGVSFELHRGEVLGIAGLVGSGSEEVPYAVAGHLGSLLGGRIDRMTDSGGRRRRAVPLVPAHRLQEGVFLEASVAENLSISSLGSLSRGPRLSARAEEAMVDGWIDRLGIDAPHGDTLIATLSGGNQQKVVLARCLNQDPEILAMSEPTAGVDIATRSRIYDLVAREAAAGLSVVVTSSDLQDLVAMCTRVLVVRDGRVVQELLGEAVTETDIIRAMEGTTAA